MRECVGGNSRTGLGGGLGGGSSHIESCRMGRMGMPRQRPCCSGYLVLGVCRDSGAGGTCLGWGGSLQRWDDPGLGCMLGVGGGAGCFRGNEGLEHVIRELGRGHRGAGQGSQVQSGDPKCRQGSLGCRTGGLGVAQGLWCRARLTNMQSKSPGCRPRSWVWARVLGEEQGSQGCRAGVSGGGGGPGCGSKLLRMQL